MQMQIQPVRSYRCYIYPTNMPPDEVEQAADTGQLKFVQIKAPNASYAGASARAVTGQCVHSVVHLEETIA